MDGEADGLSNFNTQSAGFANMPKNSSDAKNSDVATWRKKTTQGYATQYIILYYCDVMITAFTTGTVQTAALTDGIFKIQMYKICT
jgi:hypothetical protein